MLANLKRAIFNRETVTVAGGQFSGQELQAVVDALQHPMQAALDDANARQVSDPANAEFWRRLAGSLRKACGMI